MSPDPLEPSRQASDGDSWIWTRFGSSARRILVERMHFDLGGGVFCIAERNIMKKALKRRGSPAKIKMDGLRSYGAAMDERGNRDK